MAWSAKKGKEPIEVNYSRQITNWLMKYFILSQLVSIDISRKSVNKIFSNTLVRRGVGFARSCRCKTVVRLALLESYPVVVVVAGVGRGEDWACEVRC